MNFSKKYPEFRHFKTVNLRIQRIDEVFLDEAKFTSLHQSRFPDGKELLKSKTEGEECIVIPLKDVEEILDKHFVRKKAINLVYDGLSKGILEIVYKNEEGKKGKQKE